MEETISKRFEAYRRIKNLILNHQLSPGQKLIYCDLEYKLNMTKTPIISGLAMLEQEGFVVSRKNRGFYVSEINVDEAQKIFELREKLEDLVIEYAIAEYESKDLTKLMEKLKSYVNYESPVYNDKRRSLDTEFHLQIARMTKNPYLFDIIKHFYENMYFGINPVYLTPLIETFKQDHRILLEAISKKDLRKAKEVLREHNKKARNFLSSMI